MPSYTFTTLLLCVWDYWCPEWFITWGTVLGLVHKDGVKRGQQRLAELPEFQVAYKKGQKSQKSERGGSTAGFRTGRVRTVVRHMVSLLLALAQLPHVVPESARFEDTVLESK